MDVEENPTVVVDSGAAENVMPRSIIPTHPQRKRKDPAMGRGSNDQQESTSRTMDSRSCPSELLRRLYARARSRVQM